MKSIPAGVAGSFSIEIEQHVYLAPSVVPAQTALGDCDLQGMTHGDVAAVFPHAAWQTEITAIAWAVKSAPTGLGPVRPLVVLKNAVVVPPNLCVVVAGNTQA